MATWEDLDDTEQWLGERIVDFDNDHLVNLKAWLLRHAVAFHGQMLIDMFRFAAGLGGEMAQDAMDSEISQELERHPLYWIEQRPLYQAINREILKRQGYSVCRIIERD